MMIRRSFSLVGWFTCHQKWGLVVIVLGRQRIIMAEKQRVMFFSHCYSDEEMEESYHDGMLLCWGEVAIRPERLSLVETRRRKIVPSWHVTWLGWTQLVGWWDCNQIMLALRVKGSRKNPPVSILKLKEAAPRKGSRELPLHSKIYLRWVRNKF